jgi:hypothetical protein
MHANCVKGVSSAKGGAQKLFSRKYCRGFKKLVVFVPFVEQSASIHTGQTYSFVKDFESGIVS